MITATKRLSLLLSGCVLVCSGCTGTSDLALPETRSETPPVVESDVLDDVSAVAEPVGRVVGLLSDGNGGSVAVAYDTDTWEYEVIQALPDVTPDNYVALSADDTKLAYTTWSDSYTIRYVEVLDMQTGETRAFLMIWNTATRSSKFPGCQTMSPFCTSITIQTTFYKRSNISKRIQERSHG